METRSGTREGVRDVGWGRRRQGETRRDREIAEDPGNQTLGPAASTDGAPEVHPGGEKTADRGPSPPPRDIGTPEIETEEAGAREAGTARWGPDQDTYASGAPDAPRQRALTPCIAARARRARGLGAGGVPSVSASPSHLPSAPAEEGPRFVLGSAAPATAAASSALRALERQVRGLRAEGSDPTLLRPPIPLFFRRPPP